MGVAALSLPQTFLSLSFTFGIIFIILYGVANWWTFNLLASISFKYNNYNYGSLVKTLLGRKMEIIYNIAMLLSCGITIIAYNNVSK